MKTKRKILAVDDNVMFLKSLTTSLKKYGYTVIQGKTGKEALQLNKKHKPDLILMDLSMPEMDGLEACKAIKRQNPKRFVPIIFITAKKNTADVLKCLDSGADEFIAKPFKIEEVAARVRSMLRIKQLTEELQQAQQDLIETREIAAIAATAVTVNHNINTPLSGIMIHTELLSSKIPASAKSDCQYHIDAIKHEADKIAALNNKLKKLSKPNFIDYVPGTAMLRLDEDETRKK